MGSIRTAGTDQMRLFQRAVPHVQIMRYMGNKRGVLDFLIPILEDEVSQGDSVLDLFAGTGAVSYALKPLHPVIANDIQHYSYVICKALLGKKMPVDSLSKVKSTLEENYHCNVGQLDRIFGVQWKKESQFLGHRLDRSQLSKYRDFASLYPHYGAKLESSALDEQLLTWFRQETVSRYTENKYRNPYVLFSLYFANAYFGIRQCMEIDSLRYAIDQVEGEFERMVYLACLVSATSSVVSSIGHFAEFRSVNSLESYQSLLDERQKSIVGLFYGKVQELIEDYADSYRMEDLNRCYNLDYEDLLENHNKELNEIGLIYADPPYTTANYSRFYHVLETLTRYDYPRVDYVGRYRHDRHFSDFCKYSTVESAFERLCSLSSRMGSTLAISYSSSGMVGIDIIKKIAERHYVKTFLHSKSHAHSRQGRKHKMNVREYLLVCKEPTIEGRKV